MFGDLLRLQVVVLEGVSRAVSECMLKNSPLIFPVQERRVDLQVNVYDMYILSFNLFP